jgi:hypothetical protein
MSTNDTRRATMAVTIAGEGTVLPSNFFLKGKHEGHITRSEFAIYLAGHHYRCQEAAWMDEQVMLAWVEEVLAPYVATAPEEIIPLLILDSYQCHMMASVVYKIQELGVEVKHIPGRCTSLCQPVDVGFNKPIQVLRPKDVDQVDDCQRSQRRHNQLANKARHHSMGCQSNGADEGGATDH